MFIFNGLLRFFFYALKWEKLRIQIPKRNYDFIIKKRKMTYPECNGYCDDINDLASNSLGTSNGEKAGPGPLLLKILVPAYAAGSIIGITYDIT